MPSGLGLEEYVRHARLFGTDGVRDVVEGWGDSPERTRLLVELDAIDAAKPRRRFEKHTSRRRRTPEQTVAVVAALRAEGLVPAAIANKLGLSDGYVRKCLKTASQPVQASRKSGTEMEVEGIGHGHV